MLTTALMWMVAASGGMLTDPIEHGSEPINFHQLAALRLADDVPDDAPALELAHAESPFGAKGSWRFNVTGAYAIEFDDHNQLASAGVGFSYFMAERFSLETEFNAVYVDQRGDDAIAANFNLLVRWHFLEDEGQRWTMFGDLGAGLFYGNHPVPAEGSRFNFTPQAGIGFTHRLDDADTRLIVGVRWHHLSNARTSERNPGRDSMMVYLGLSVPF